ncbi:ankyrin repeat domain-containing protein 11 isoform X1 [Parasteatoda tepidariorum]|uniref:ankyrin repeat domain-containing protein 11 isoform X1 n=1 Tax=Parasteatoda tepidariorum TaxID=114398 RepID=UPI001C71A260|nr:uncharacterized protein LOC107439074 [Parasteatoda tepidariorum]
MFNILRICTSSFTASNYSATFYRALRNPSKRVSVIKTIKEFKVKHMNEEDEDHASFDLEEMSRRVKKEDLDIAEAFEKGEDFQSIVTESSRLYDRQIREKESGKIFIKKKLIGRKYFQSEKETNLLTYAAKEQIKYLHKLNPLDWTPEALSKSFPISVDGVKKLLRSNYTLKDPVKIKQHDEDVRKKWESLMSGKPSDQIYFHTQCLWNEGKLLKENYTGNPNLPYPSLSTTQNITKVTKNKLIGEYSGIIKNYVEYKKQKKSVQENNSELIVPTEKEYDRRSETVKHITEASNFLKKSKFFKEDGDIAIKKKDYIDEAELPFSQFKENIKHQLKHDSKKSNTSKQYLQWIEQESKEKDFKNPTNFFNAKDFVSKISKYSKENIEMKREKNSAEDSFYLYNEKTGYQRPVGQTFKGKVSIPISAWKKNTLYKVKNCVYDEDGEFLYKLPS